jgi:hypothetical protein
LTPYVVAGLGPGLRRFAKRLLAPIVEWNTLVFQTHGISEEPVPATEPTLSLREATQADVLALAATFARSPTMLSARLVRGDRAFCAFADDGEPVHMRWLSIEPTEVAEVGLWICPRPREVYVYDVMTAPGWRGHHVFAQVRAMSDRALRAIGCTTKLSYVRGDNHSVGRALSPVQDRKRILYTIAYVRVRKGPVFYSGSYGPPLYPWPHSTRERAAAA